MGRLFLMLWPDIIEFGRIKLDIVTGMSVTHSVRGLAHSYIEPGTTRAEIFRRLIELRWPVLNPMNDLAPHSPHIPLSSPPSPDRLTRVVGTQFCVPFGF